MLEAFEVLGSGVINRRKKGKKKNTAVKRPLLSSSHASSLLVSEYVPAFAYVCMLRAVSSPAPQCKHSLCVLRGKTAKH